MLVYLLICCRVEVCMPPGLCGGQKKLTRVGSLLPPCRFQGSNSGCQLPRQASSASEPSHSPAWDLRPLKQLCQKLGGKLNFGKDQCQFRTRAGRVLNPSSEVTSHTGLKQPSILPAERKLGSERQVGSGGMFFFSICLLVAGP